MRRARIRRAVGGQEGVGVPKCAKPSPNHQHKCGRGVWRLEEKEWEAAAGGAKGGQTSRADALPPGWWAASVVWRWRWKRCGRRRQPGGGFTVLTLLFFSSLPRGLGVGGAWHVQRHQGTLQGPQHQLFCFWRSKRRSKRRLTIAGQQGADGALGAPERRPLLQREAEGGRAPGGGVCGNCAWGMAGVGWSCTQQVCLCRETKLSAAGMDVKGIHSV